jgi:hypothetical protein
MKKLICAFALSFVLSPFVPQAKSDVSVDFFYDNLDGGSWVEVGNYGYCWQPDVASDPSWRPYSDGYWAYTDLGWTWISYEDWGWATYHYGRWVRIADYGWVWRPGYEWAPAWVSWRFGGGYAGWAPLPPETEVVYESRPLTDQIDVEFDIGPAYYNFVDVRYIGEPALRTRIVPYEQNVTYVTQTVNVTNITYKNKTVYNYGPDLNVVNQYSTRPVQTLKLERQSNVDVRTAAKSGGLTRVQGNALVVAAPPEIKKSATTPRPPKVKTRLAQPKVEKGWSLVGDENAKNQLKQKFKAENPKNIPPPSAGGNAAAAANASASVAPGASGPVAASPIERGKGKHRGAQQFQAGAAAGASASPDTAGVMSSPAMSPEFGRQGQGKGKGKHRAAEQFQAGASPTPDSTGEMISPATNPAFGEQGKRKGKGRGADQFQSGAAPSPLTPPGADTSATGAPEFGKRGKGKRHEQFGDMPVAPAPTTSDTSATGASEFGKRGKGKGRQQFGETALTPAPTTSGENFAQPQGRGKRFERQNLQTPLPAPTDAPQGFNQPRGGGKHRQFEQPAQPPAGQENVGSQNPYGEARGRRGQEFNAPPAGGMTQSGHPGEAAERKREAKGVNQEAPVATPTPIPR